MWTGDYRGPPTDAGDLGDLSLKAGGELRTSDGVWTGDRSGYGYGFGQGDLSLEAARIELRDAYVATYDEAGSSGNIHLVADELVIADSNLSTAGSDAAFDGEQVFTTSGSIQLEARELHIEDSTVETGPTNGGVGNIYFAAEDAIWIDGSSVLTGEVPCPDGGDPYYGRGAIEVAAGSSVVFAEGATEVYSGIAIGACNVPTAGVTLRAGERVFVSPDATRPIALGYALGEDLVDPPLIDEGALLPLPSLPTPPRGILSYSEHAYGYLTSKPIDSGSDRPEFLAGAIELLSLPSDATVHIRFGATDDPVCADYTWRDDPADLPPRRYFAYQIDLEAYGPVSPVIDAVVLRYVAHGCDTPGAGPCDDNNPCTDDACVAGTCQFVPNDPDCHYDSDSCGGGETQ